MAGSRRRASGDLVGACESGDRRAALEALRYKLAEAVVDAPAYSVAALAKQLAATMKEIAELPAPKKVSTADDLAARRAKRRAAAARRASSAGTVPELGRGGS